MTSARRAVRLLPRVEPHETPRVALAAVCFACVAPGALIARAAGDALFLSHFGSGPLPVMYIAGGVVTALGTYACVRASRRLTTGRIAIGVGSLLLLANLALFASFGAFPSLSRAAAYLLADVSVRIPVFLFWAFASEIFDAQESRRLFGLIGSAGTAACLPAGLFVGPFARRAGTESLVLLTAVLMGGFLVSAAALVRRERSHAGIPAGPATGGAASARRLLGTPQFVSIAALSVVMSLVETLVDYQFKTTAASIGSSASLANIFGTLYAAASVASLLIQLVIVHRLLAVAGVLASLAVLPGVLLLAQAGVFRFRSGGWVFTTKALDVTLTTTVNGTARQLLYRGILPQSRLTARALADGIYLPLAIGLAGAGLGISSGSVSVAAAAAAGAAGCVVWLLYARMAHKAYVSGLLDALKARRFGFEEEPLVSRAPALKAWLHDAFDSASDEDLIYLATVLPQLGSLVGPAQLQAALARENPNVKVAILQSIRGGRRKEELALARALARHAEPEVRRAAILAASDPAAHDFGREEPKSRAVILRSLRGRRREGESASTRASARRAESIVRRAIPAAPGLSRQASGLEWLEDALADPEPRVRAAAAAGLANAAGFQARALGRERLGAMVHSKDPRSRVAAAEALEHVADRSASEREIGTRLVARLLEDADVSVVLAALETIRMRRLSPLALPVLSLLERPLLAGAASDALAAMGPAAIGPVLSFWESQAGRLRGAALAKIPEVLERIGDPRALPVVTLMLTPKPPEERTALFRSYVRLLLRYRRAGADAHRERLDALFVEECREAEARISSRGRLGEAPAVQLARDALSDLVAGHVENAFILLSGRVRNVDMAVLHRQITSGPAEERSRALEILENVLPKGLREPLLAVLVPAAGEAEAEPAEEVFDLLSGRDPEWVTAGAAWAARELALVSCADRLGALKTHQSAVVRETAVFALEGLEGGR